MKISILQWNVWFKEQADTIVSLLQHQNADIICLQELTMDSYLNPQRNIPNEIAQLGYHACYEIALSRSGSEHIAMGNGIFSKHPIINQKHVYVQRETPGSNNYAHENRIYIEATVGVHGKKLKIGTVHLSYAHAFTSTEEKRVESDTLLEAIKHNEHDFVLAGDMNATPGSYTIDRLQEHFKNAGPDFAEATWTTKPFSYDGFEANALDWRLDYIFTSPDIKTLSGKILQTEASDHLPLLAELEI